MHSIAAAVVKAGILPEETLAEFRRWGHPVEAPTTLPVGPEEVVNAIEKALQEEGLVVTRETDLEAVTDFLKTQAPGELTVVLEEPDGTEHTTSFPCPYGMTAMGEFILQWHSDSIEDVMINGKTHLSFQSPDTLGARVEVYFTRVRELFFGTQKAFMICTPSTPVKLNG